MDDSDFVFYSIYASKYNRETLQTLKYEFTYLELRTHKEFIEAQEDLEAEATKNALEEDRS